ncbi:hypothetical protein D3C80_2199350 [compost metagenome]
MQGRFGTVVRVVGAEVDNLLAGIKLAEQRRHVGLRVGGGRHQVVGDLAETQPTQLFFQPRSLVFVRAFQQQ